MESKIITMYDKEYFIKKFEAIPEEKWLTGIFVNEDKCCALGHCGERFLKPTVESNALGRICKYSVASINDGNGIFKNYGSTPKERILNFLKQLK